MKELAIYLVALRSIAASRADGHYTIMKFTTNYRVGLGTVSSEEDIKKMAEGETLIEAIKNLINDIMEDDYKHGVR